MKIRLINDQKVWQGESIPSYIADRPNITHYEQRTDLHEADGFYDAVVLDIPEGSKLVSETWTIEDDKAIQGGVVKTDEEIESERQAAKSADLKTAENNFILLCDVIRQTAGQVFTQNKLSTLESELLLEQIEAVDFQAASKLGLKALAAIREVELAGGNWSDTIWHEDII